MLHGGNTDMKNTFSSLKIQKFLPKVPGAFSPRPATAPHVPGLILGLVWIRRRTERATTLWGTSRTRHPRFIQSMVVTHSDTRHHPVEPSPVLRPV